MSQLLPNGNRLSTGKQKRTDRASEARDNLSAVARPSFAEVLRSTMKNHDVRQSELAWRLKVSPAAVSRWLSKERFPQALELLAIARVLEIDPFVLVGSDFVEPRDARPAPTRGRPPITKEGFMRDLDDSPSAREKKPTTQAGSKRTKPTRSTS